jgi:Methyltransferase domain
MRPESDPDASWVSSLAGVSTSRADRAIEEARKETRLFGELDRMHRTGGRSFYIEIDAPLELYALTRLLRPRHVVEVGVSSGVSSAYFLCALERNGRGTLHSVDLPQEDRRRPDLQKNPSWSLPAGRSSGWAVPMALRKRWDLRLGDKKEVLPLLSEELGEIDLFLYDVPHSDPGAYHEFLAIDRRFHSGSVGMVDHGGTLEICPSLRRWARRRHATPLRRSGLGLSGFRRP